MLKLSSFGFQSTFEDNRATVMCANFYGDEGMRLLVIVVALAVLCDLAAAQSPPVKMGLWESTTVTTVANFQEIEEQMKKLGLPNGWPAVAKQNCKTVASWQKGREEWFTPPAGCTVTNKTVSARGYSVAFSCSVPEPELMQLKMSFDTKELIHGTMHTITTFPKSVGGGQMVTDSKITDRFLGVDCAAATKGLGSTVR
jgi:hypothetical protein